MVRYGLHGQETANKGTSTNDVPLISRGVREAELLDEVRCVGLKGEEIIQAIKDGANVFEMPEE